MATSSVRVSVSPSDCATRSDDSRSSPRWARRASASSEKYVVSPRAASSPRAETSGVTVFSPARAKSHAHVLGISEEDFPLIKAWAWDFARAGEKTVTSDVSARGDEAARGLTAYFSELAEVRRAGLGDDLLSSLLVAESDGDTLTRTELVANLVLLLQAGHETTQDLLGNAQVALFRHPDQLTLMREQPDLTKNAVEEFLRYDTSVQISHRVVLDGARLDGTEIPERAMVYTLNGAVNRDPDRFAEPDRLDITRDIPHHLAFSFGAYYCLGAALARLETAVGTRALIDRFPTLRPATGWFEWRDTLQLRGPQTLAVTW